MAKTKRADAYVEYAHPANPEDPKQTFWLGGKNDGKSLAEAPEKPRGRVVLKVDPDEAELRLKERELARLGDVGKLALETEHAGDYYEWKKREHSIAKRFHEHSWMRHKYLPPPAPRMWPIYLMVGLLTLAFATQAWITLTRSAPPLSDAPPPAAKTDSHASPRQGRANVVTFGGVQ